MRLWSPEPALWHGATRSGALAIGMRCSVAWHCGGAHSRTLPDPGTGHVYTGIVPLPRGGSQRTSGLFWHLALPEVWQSAQRLNVFGGMWDHRARMPAPLRSALASLHACATPQIPEALSQYKLWCLESPYALAEQGAAPPPRASLLCV